KNTEFFILTDIQEVPDVVIRGLIENEVTSEILHFIPGHNESSIPERVTWLHCTGITQWKSSVQQIGDGISKLLFYYTGHGTYSTSNNMLFPNRDSLPLLELRDMILGLCTPDADVVFLLDAGHSGSLGMPYRLETSTETYSLMNDTYFCTQNVLVLSSCGEGQVSYSELFRSHFTSRFLAAVDKSTNLSAVLRDIYTQWKNEGGNSD